MSFDLSKIPRDLMKLQQWVVWKIELTEDKKPTKIPYQPAHPKYKASTTKPETWGTIDQAVAATKPNRFLGPGFVFSETDDYSGVDIDHCRNKKTGELKYCAEVLLDYLNSYREVSPSETGIHAIIKAKVPPGGNSKGLPCGCKIEMYSQKRFFTFTGAHLEGTPPTIEPRQAELDTLHKEIFGKTSEKPKQAPPCPAPDISDFALIDKAKSATNGNKFCALWDGDTSLHGGDDSVADLALCSMLAFYTGPDPARIDRLFRQSGLCREKWERRQDYRDRTTSKALDGMTEFYTPPGGSERPQEATADDGQDYDQTEREAIRGEAQAAPQMLNVTPMWPQEVMTGAAGRFSRSYADYLETPEQFLFMSYLTVLGHVLVDNIVLESEIDPQLRLFTVNVGESADTRKSTSISKTNSFFRETIAEDDFNPIWGVGSAEGLAKCFEKNNKVLLILDELQAIVKKMRIDASVLLPCINALFEGNKFHNITKKQDIQLNNAKLCILAASTLDTYRNMFTSSFINIGFLNRLFIIIGDGNRKFSIPDRMPDNKRDSLKNDLREVLSFVGELSRDGCYSMTITPQAKEIFDAWYFGLEHSIFIKRLDTYGHRLMPLLAVNELKDTITPEIAQRVVGLLNYQLAARKFADPIDADNLIARIEERIRRLLKPGPLAKRDLERAGNKNRAGIGPWEQAIKGLINGGEIYVKNGIFHLIS